MNETSELVAPCSSRRHSQAARFANRDAAPECRRQLRKRPICFNGRHRLECQLAPAPLEAAAVNSGERNSGRPRRPQQLLAAGRSAAPIGARRLCQRRGQHFSLRRQTHAAPLKVRAARVSSHKWLERGRRGTCCRRAGGSGTGCGARAFVCVHGVRGAAGRQCCANLVH